MMLSLPRPLRYCCITLLLLSPLLASTQPFTHADSIRGGLRPARTTWDVQHYDLHLRVDLANRSISGHNDIRFAVLAPTRELQIDLQDRYAVSAITLDGKALTYRRDAQALFLQLPRALKPGARHTLRITYAGTPPVAQNAPWDGGFVWKTDANGLPFVGVACEGLGASSWWPCKDHPADEPDSVSTHFTLTDSRVRAIGNGQDRGTTTHKDGSRTFHWAVTYPINSYNVTLNIGDYLTQHDTLQQANGQTLALHYHPLRQNAAKAATYFPAQVKPMLRAYERILGPYPFPRDGFTLVETDYWGMEHQGAVAYGNGYGSNPRRFDYNGWDFIIIHETGHEWFGNWISAADHGDLWIHESWTTYVEALYEESQRGYASAVRFLQSRRGFIRNQHPMQGPSGVNFDKWPDADMYYKGAWMLHTLRSVVNNDSVWYRMLRGIGPQFGMRTTRTANLTQWIDQQLGADYQWFWRAYLNHAQQPTLRWKLTSGDSGSTLTAYWETAEADFRMPIEIVLPGNQRLRITPTTQPQQFELRIASSSDLRFDLDRFYYQLKVVE